MKTDTIKTASVRKWGNGYGVLLPKSFVAALEWQDVEIETILKEHSVILTKRPRKQELITRSEMLKGMSVKDKHELVDFGKPVGNEIW